MFDNYTLCKYAGQKKRKTKWEIIQWFLFNVDMVFNGSVVNSRTTRNNIIIPIFIFISVGTYCPGENYTVPFTGYIFSWKDTPTGSDDMLPCPLDYFGTKINIHECVLRIDWLLVA